MDILNIPLAKSVDLGFDFWECEPDKLTANDKKELAKLETFFRNLVSDAGFTVVHSFGEPYPNGAFSIVVVLEESAVTIYSWPEYGWVELRIHFCNNESDNRQKAVRTFNGLRGHFRPKRIDYLPIRSSSPP